jgi:hypothetical protein
MIETESEDLRTLKAGMIARESDTPSIRQKADIAVPPQWTLATADRSELGRMPKLKKVFARPPFERQLIFRTDAITLRPKSFSIMQIVSQFVEAAK